MHKEYYFVTLIVVKKQAMARPKPNTVAEYIAGFPKETQKVLEQIRTTIKKVMPEAEEVISYAIPTFKLDKSYVIYFAGFDHHIGIYPAPVREESFQKAFSKYKTGRGSIQFPLDEPMPLTLITKIAKYRLKVSLEEAKLKKVIATKKAASKKQAVKR